MNNIDNLLDKPVWQMTGAEFLELSRQQSPTPEEPPHESEHPKVPKYVYGMNGLAQLLGCSIATAHRIKASGIIKDAITQIGRKIIIDQEKAIELISKRKRGHLK
jgi:hypothetical protein